MSLDCACALTIVAAGVLLFAALHDIAFRTIPNWASAALVLVGCLMRILDHRLVAGAGCGAAVFVLAVLCWWRGWLGGGDAKLLGAAAVLAPPSLVPDYVTMVALAGGGLALIYLVLERLMRRRCPGGRVDRSCGASSWSSAGASGAAHRCLMPQPSAPLPC